MTLMTLQNSYFVMITTTVEPINIKPSITIVSNSKFKQGLFYKVNFTLKTINNHILFNLTSYCTTSV